MKLTYCTGSPGYSIGILKRGLWIQLSIHFVRTIISGEALTIIGP